MRKKWKRNRRRKGMRRNKGRMQGSRSMTKNWWRNRKMRRRKERNNGRKNRPRRMKKNLWRRRRRRKKKKKRNNWRKRRPIEPIRRKNWRSKEEESNACICIKCIATVLWAYSRGQCICAMCWSLHAN